jgi:spore coat protein H
MDGTRTGIRTAAAIGLLVSVSLILTFAAPAQQPDSPAGLFHPSRIWTVHLNFTADQWEAMEPQGEQGPGPGFGPGQDQGFGPGPGGREGLFPSMLFVKGFLAGDRNGDGKLSREEFQGLAERWFTDWSQGGRLTAEEVKTGVAAAFPLPSFRPPGAGGPGAGPDGESRGNRRNGMSAMAGIDFEYVRAELEFGGEPLGEVAVRYKGNNTFMMSRNSLKRSLKLDLNKYDKERRLAGQTTLNLHNNVNDPSWMNETLSYGLFRDGGVPAPRTGWARVFVTVPGKYQRKYFGLYSLVENIDKHFAKDRFGTAEGAILKPVTRDLFGYLGGDWSQYGRMYDPKTDLTRRQKARIIEFAQFVSGSPDAEFSSRLGDYLDLEEFARFMAVTVWLSNLDSILGMGQNYYVYLHPETNKFQFLPWDLDHSFGQFPMAGGDASALSIARPWQGRNRFLERVFGVEAFRKLYFARVAGLGETLSKPERIAGQVDDTAKTIRAAVAEESETKLAAFEAAVSGKSPGARQQADRRRNAGSEAEMPGFPGPPPGVAASFLPIGGPAGRLEGSPGSSSFLPGGPPGRAFNRSIKLFATERARSVSEQLNNPAKAVPAVEERESGMPSGPPLLLDQVFLSRLNVSKAGALTPEEFAARIPVWFRAWNTDGSGALTAEQVREGLDRDFAPLLRNVRGPGFGPPGMPPPF